MWRYCIFRLSLRATTKKGRQLQTNSWLRLWCVCSRKTESVSLQDVVGGDNAITCISFRVFRQCEMWHVLCVIVLIYVRNALFSSLVPV